MTIRSLFGPVPAPSRKVPVFRANRPRQRPGQPGSPRDRNRTLQTGTLCDAALELFLRHGIDGVTVEQITNAAGVAKGSFYRYFDDQAELVLALIQPLLPVRDVMQHARTALAIATTDGLVTAYRELAMRLSEVLLPEPRLVRLYLQESRMPASPTRVPIRRLADDVADLAIELTHAARSRGLLRDLPPAVTALAVLGAVEALLFRALDRGDLPAPVESAEALVAMVLEGVRAGTDRPA